MKILLSLDLSTTCTGWSTFDLDSKKLVSYGYLKPSTKVNGTPISKEKYPMQQLLKMQDLSCKILNLIEQHKPTHIVIEEIAGSKNRLGQKVLDGFHFILLTYIQKYIPIIEYYDVSGKDGWRTHLGFRLTEADKQNNKENRKLNNQLAKGTRKLPIIDNKDLACRHVNAKYGLMLDAQTSQSDTDLADSVSMGSAWIEFKYPSR